MPGPACSIRVAWLLFTMLSVLLATPLAQAAEEQQDGRMVFSTSAVELVPQPDTGLPLIRGGHVVGDS